MRRVRSDNDTPATLGLRRLDGDDFRRRQAGEGEQCDDRVGVGPPALPQARERGGVDAKLERCLAAREARGGAGRLDRRVNALEVDSRPRDPLQAHFGFGVVIGHGGPS